MRKELIDELNLACEELNEEIVTNPEGDVRFDLGNARERLRNAVCILSDSSDEAF